MLPFPKFESAIDSSYPVLETGKQAHQDKLIKQIHPISDHEWIAIVQSQTLPNHDYQVIVRIKDGKVSYHGCNCPFDYGDICKHVVATLYEIRKKKLHEKEWKRPEEVEYDRRKSKTVSFLELDNSHEQIKENKVPNSSKNIIESELVELSVRTSDSKKSDSSEVDFVEQEFECNVCLCQVERPVMLPCQSHCICYDCLARLFARRTIQKGGYRHIICPMCSEKGGKLTVRNMESVKLARKIERIQKAYELEKAKFKKRYERLENQRKEEKSRFDNFIRIHQNTKLIMEADSSQIKKLKKANRFSNDTIIVIDDEDRRMSIQLVSENEFKRSISCKSEAISTAENPTIVPKLEAIDEIASISSKSLILNKKNSMRSSLKSRTSSGKGEVVIDEEPLGDLGRPRRSFGREIQIDLTESQNMENLFMNKPVIKAPPKTNSSTQSPNISEIIDVLLKDSDQQRKESEVLSKRKNPYQDDCVEVHIDNESSQNKENKPSGFLSFGIKKVKSFMINASGVLDKGLSLARNVLRSGLLGDNTEGDVIIDLA